MKRISAILFFTAYLLSTTEAYQLLKLPTVFQHYREHKLADNKLGFLEFLDLHYMHGSPRDGDYERDMKLPFKTSAFYIGSVAPAFMPLMVQVPLTITVEISEKKRYNIPYQVILSSFMSNIWQPPRNV